jgi:hypothetical protein
VSLAELLLAAGVLAFGLLPIVSGIQSTAREARFLEFRSQAISRAGGLLSAAQVLGPRVFAQVLGDRDEAPLSLALPPFPQSGPREDTTVDRMGFLEETVTVKEVSRAGAARLYMLTARVRWLHPSEPDRPQEVLLVTMQGDPRASINQPESP